MENLEIKVSKKTRMVDLPKQFITVDGENLQSKIIFSFIDEFVKGQARLEYEINNEKKYLALNKENETYTLAVSSILTKEGYINMQLVIDEDSEDETLPVFKSNKFYLYCNPSINAVDEEPESSYELWIQQADKKLNEVDNLDISIKNSVITITNKNGESFSENVKGDKGEKGDPGAVKMQVVDTLPDTGETDTIYLLKKDTPGEQNLYDEYVYTETSGWEHIGDTSVDLTDYYTKVETDERLNNKQDTLTAGDNITIENNVISASGGKSELYTFYTGIDYNFNRPDNIYKSALSTDKRNILDTMLCNIITDAMTTDNKAKMLLLTFNNSNQVQGLPYILFTFGDNQKLDTSRTTYRMVSIPNGINNQILYTYYIDINGSWENNVFSVSNWIITKSKQITVLSTDTGLSKTNTKAYTPSEPYNPATKKYVDDNKYTLPVASAETLGGIKLGEGLSADENGVVSVEAQNIPEVYVDSLFPGGQRPITDTIFLEKLETLINKYKDKSYTIKKIACFVDFASNQTYPYYMSFSCPSKIMNTRTSYNFHGDVKLLGVYADKRQCFTSKVIVNGNWIDDIFHIASCYIVGVPENIVMISIDNTYRYTPTGDYNPSTKLYTDKTHYENMTGYDATKTQVLKNVNGTLTWVDEV